MITTLALITLVAVHGAVLARDARHRSPAPVLVLVHDRGSVRPLRGAGPIRREGCVGRSSTCGPAVDLDAYRRRRTGEHPEGLGGRR